MRFFTRSAQPFRSQLVNFTGKGVEANTSSEGLGAVLRKPICRGFCCRTRFGSSVVPKRLPPERVHPRGVVLEIHKPVTVVQFHLQLPQHGKPQKARNLRPSVATYGGEV